MVDKGYKPQAIDFGSTPSSKIKTHGERVLGRKVRFLIFTRHRSQVSAACLQGSTFLFLVRVPSLTSFQKKCSYRTTMC
jgi:hypothetical protein